MELGSKAKDTESVRKHNFQTWQFVPYRCFLWQLRSSIYWNLQSRYPCGNTYWVSCKNQHTRTKHRGTNRLNILWLLRHRARQGWEYQRRRCCMEERRPQRISFQSYLAGWPHYERNVYPEHMCGLCQIWIRDRSARCVRLRKNNELTEKNFDRTKIKIWYHFH